MADILVVDDNEITVRSIDRLLSHEGYNVVTAANSNEAKTLLSQFTFDVAITDLMMPIINGMELVRYIVANYPDTHIIVISSIDDERSRLECYNLGIDNFFTKPFMQQELLVKMRVLLKNV